jgi:hypothetical protein
LVNRIYDDDHNGIWQFIASEEFYHLYPYHALFGCKDSSEVISRGHEHALLLVTQAIDKIMTGEGLADEDLALSKLLMQNIVKYKNPFPHVSAAIQLSNSTGKLSYERRYYPICLYRLTAQQSSLHSGTYSYR